MTFMEKFLHDLHPTNLRPIFYLITPNESMHYKTMEEVPRMLDDSNLWMLILVILELFVLDDRQWAFNDTVTSINAGVCSVLMKFGGRYASAALYPWFFSHFKIIDLDPHATSTWILCFFTQDLCYYLAHRAVHEFGIFWSFHQMHHSSEYYNLSTALRQGMWQDFGTCGFDLLQSIAIPPNIFIVHRYLNIAYQFWLHTELVPYLGPLEWVLNTPSSHRVHHGRNPYCIDRNYGGTLIIWDRLFGTYEPERPEEKVTYGLVTNVRTFNQMYCQNFEFKELGFDKGQMKNEKGEPIFPGIWNKIKCVFMPPGFFPGVRTKWFFFWKCVEDNMEGIPEIEPNPQPYNPPISIPLKVYLVTQLAAVLSYAIDFNLVRGSMEWSSFLLQLSFILSTIQMFGYYFDHELVFCENMGSWLVQIAFTVVRFSARGLPFDTVRLLTVAYYGFTTQNVVSISYAALSLASIVILSICGYSSIKLRSKKID